MLKENNIKELKPVLKIPDETKTKRYNFDQLIKLRETAEKVLNSKYITFTVNGERLIKTEDKLYLTCILDTNNIIVGYNLDKKVLVIGRMKDLYWNNLNLLVYTIDEPYLQGFKGQIDFYKNNVKGFLSGNGENDINKFVKDMKLTTYYDSVFKYAPNEKIDFHLIRAQLKQIEEIIFNECKCKDENKIYIKRIIVKL